jgi:hypothetical protein
MQEIHLPDEYKNIGENYGRVSWAVRGICEGYTGWFSGSPSVMYDIPQTSIYPDLVLLAGGKGGWDLYLSFRDQNNLWSGLLNLGNTINTSDNESNAAFSPDGKYLFFPVTGISTGSPQKSLKS